MGQADSERFLRWYYDEENYRTGLWKRLSNIARYELHDAWDADSQLDELVARLYKRAGNEAHDLFPVPLPGIEVLEDQPDYDDIAHYSQAATRRLAKSSNRKTSAEVSIDYRSEEILSGNSPDEMELVVAPSAASAFDTLSVSLSLNAWCATLLMVRNKLKDDERLAEPADRPGFLAFLDHLIDDTTAFTDWQAFAMDHESVPLISAAERAALGPLSPSVPVMRRFRTRFHHAFWRTCGELIAESSLPLEVPQDVAHLSAFAGEEIGRFMLLQHEGMMSNRPRPFIPRGTRGDVPGRVLVRCGRETWWNNLVRRTAPGSPPLRPPTRYFLASDEVRRA